MRCGTVLLKKDATQIHFLKTEDANITITTALFYLTGEIGI